MYYTLYEIRYRNKENYTVFYTNRKRQDGFGAQYQNIIFSICYCSKHQLPFLYSPLYTIEHNYENNPNYINDLENFINLKPFLQVKNNQETIELTHEEVFGVIQSKPDYYLSGDTMDMIRNAFYKYNSSRFDIDSTHIAIHIRVCNNLDVTLDSFRITEFTYYKSIMNQMRKLYNNVRFHIYSQGNKEYFKELHHNDVIYHLDEDIRLTFTDLVYSDILITAKSALSFTAAILHYKKNIYYHPNWNSPILKYWNKVIQ